MLRIFERKICGDGIIYTYNDLQKITGEREKMQFIYAVISEHESSQIYRNGAVSGLFYRGSDPDLEAIKKVVYDREGNAHIDTVSPNHKLTSNLYHLFINQLVSYELGNGVSFNNPEIKKALGGAEFDYILQQILIYAANDGEAYGLVTDDGIIPLCCACKVNGDEPLFIPLKDEDDGEVKSGIRYWRLAEDKPLRVTLYEADGWTEYKEAEDGNLQIYREKMPYRVRRISNKIEGEIGIVSQKSGDFPIVFMKFINNQSSIVGNRAKLFAYDVVLSGMVNCVDMNTVYWTLRNAEGMSPQDDLNLVADMIYRRIIHTPEDVEVKKEEISTNHKAFSDVLGVLRQQLFTDFQAVDTESVSSRNVTTVEIKAAYENLNLKCDEIERYIASFIRGCLKVKGFDQNEPFHFKRPNNINELEYVTKIAGISAQIGDETALKLICEALGLIDEYEKILEKKEAQDMENFGLE